MTASLLLDRRRLRTGKPGRIRKLFLEYLEDRTLPSGTPIAQYTEALYQKLGLCDMHGNVWQWNDTALGSDRAYRGGCWAHDGISCRAARRYGIPPSFRNNGAPHPSAGGT
jgi:formylglycine-generating enzyme required for sulfatase activity